MTVLMVIGIVAVLGVLGFSWDSSGGGFSSDDDSFDDEKRERDEAFMRQVVQERFDSERE